LMPKKKQGQASDVPARIIAHVPKKPWTPEARTAGVNAYLATGSVRKAAELTGIPKSTIEDWLADPANEQILDEARRIHARAAAVDAQAVWRQATAHVADALENGDWRISPKGDAIRIPVSAKDAAYIAGTMADKARQWGELAYGGQAPADLSPERAEQLAREILRIDRELERRQTVETTATAVKTQAPIDAAWEQPHQQDNQHTSSSKADSEAEQQADEQAETAASVQPVSVGSDSRRP